jgi:hypothetical protein
MRRILMFAGSVLILPAFAIAQHHGGMASAGAVAAPSHATVVPAAGAGVHMTATHGMTPSAVIHRTRVNGTVIRTANGVFTSVPVISANTANVPGLGFDFAHLAAVNAGRVRRDRFPLNSGFGVGGFLFSSPGVIVEDAQPETQYVPEEGAAANPSANRPENAREAIDAEYFSASSAAEPQHDAAEYVFVRRDGGLVFAVAYSWENGTLRYVTRDGLRLSVQQTALDMDATQQFNEQRGLSFRSPA